MESVISGTYRPFESRDSKTVGSNTTEDTFVKAYALDKLKFSSPGKLYGRDKECGTIRSVFDAALHKEKQLLLLTGAAGTGKSVLAHEAKLLVRELGGFFLMGKYERQEKDEPFSGIAMAIQVLCEDLLLHKQTTDLGNSFQRWSFTFSDFVGKLESDLDPAAIELLVGMVPSLGDVVGIRRKSFKEDQHYRDRKLSIRDAFLRFLRVIVSFGPLVLLLDDIHWIDEASMDLVEATMLDESLQTVMIIGTSRDNEVDEKHVLTRRMESIQQSAMGSSNVTKIELKKLTETDIAELLMDITGEEESSTKELAKLVERKTAGNALYITQFLLTLRSRNLLKFDYLSATWCWDIEAIKSGSMVTENVVELLTNKLKSLEPAMQDFLPRIACLGSRFSAAHFELLVQRFCDKEEVERIIVKYKEKEREAREKRNTSQSSKSASNKPSKGNGAKRAHSQRNSLLWVLEAEDLIVLNRGYYTWGHDRIEEAALGLAGESSLKTMELEIGIWLLENNAQEADLFLVTNLLNNGISETEDESIRVKLAELNLESGKSAFASSAFGPAADYFVKGINCLGGNKWKSNFDLALQLYSNASEAHMCVGNHEKTKELCDEVLKSDRLTLLQKRRCYNALIASLVLEDRVVEAKDMCVSALKGLGVTMPKYAKGIHAAFGMIRMITAVEKTTDKLKTLKANTSEETEWSLDLLDQLISTAWVSEDQALMPLAMLKGLRLTLDHGIAKMSAPILSIVALVLSTLVGDLAGGKKYADMAVQLSSKKTEARVLFVTSVLVLHFQVPYEECIKQLFKAYEAGLRSGDFQSASGSISCAIGLSIYDGKTPLKAILEDCKKYSVQIKIYEQKIILSYTQIYWQMVQNMIDGSTCKIKGEHFDEDNFLQEQQDNKHLVARLLYRCKVITAFWFDDMDEVMKIMDQRNYHKFSMDKTDPGVVDNKPMYLYLGLTCVSLAAKNKGTMEERKFKKRATKFLHKIRGLAQKGDPNVQHAEALLDAELAGLYGNRYVAAAQYEVAVLLGERWGFICDTALAHERFADFLIKKNEAPRAIGHYDKAFDLYEQWGAKCRLNSLRERAEHLKMPVHQIEVASRMQSDDNLTQISAL